MFLLPRSPADFETWNLVCRLGGRVALNLLFIIAGPVLFSVSLVQLQRDEIINI